MRERRWYPVLQSFIANGTKDGRIAVIDSSGFFVKMQVIISSDTKPNLQARVNRVEEGFIYVGSVGDKSHIDSRIDLTGYTVIDNAAISFQDSAHTIPPIDMHDIFNAVYVREPSVALRTLISDIFGRPVSVIKDGDKFRLAVDASFGDVSVEIAYPSKAVIQNVNSGTHLVEQEIVLPNNVSKFSVKIRGHKDIFRVGFIPGSTSASFETIEKGFSFDSPIVNVPDGYKIYLMCENKDNVTYEITSWVDPV